MPTVYQPTSLSTYEPQIKGAMGSVVILAICFCAGEAWPQTVSGSIVVVSISNRKAIVAADSRVRAADGTHDDGYCKIIALGDKLIFAATGIVSEQSDDLPENLRFGATVEARRVFSEFMGGRIPTRDPPRGMIQTLADEWGKRMDTHFQDASPIRLQDWLRMMQKRSSFVEGIFVGLEPNGELAESFASVAYNPALPGLQPGPIAKHVPVTIEIGEEQEPVQGFGLPDIVAEFNSGKSDRAVKEKLQMDDLRKRVAPDKFDRILAIRLVDLTIAYHLKRESVGGLIDAIELPRGGTVRWLQRKQICPTD